MKKDLQLAFHWFTHPNNTPRSYLTAEGMQIVEEIKSALSSHDLSLARQITNSLYSDAMRDRREVGEILIHGGIFGFLLGGNENYHFAKDQFRNLVNTYFGQDLHYWAISLWLLGFTYWHLPEYKRDATQQWEYSLRILTDLSYSPKSINPDWYQKIRFQVLEAFFLSRMFDQYFPVSQVKYLRLRPTLQPSASASPKAKTTARNLKVRALPIYQYVPAGGWGVVEPDEVGYSEMDGLTIEGLAHQANNLRGSGQIILQDSISYALVRITGTSMNLNDIQTGDYVIIQRQDDADHMDIVLAERIGIDSEATLKRLHKQGKTVELHPESDDPSNPILSVDKRDNLRILGIAIAVLKPLPPSENGSETSD